MPRVPRWLPWAVAGLLALLVLVAPSTVEGLTTTHEKAVKCVEDGKVWLDGACCKAFDGATQKCRKGESTESTGGGDASSSKKGKKGGKKGSKTTKTTTTTTADDTQDTSGDDEVKPKGKNKSSGGGGKGQGYATWHYYENGTNDPSSLYCADKLSEKRWSELKQKTNMWTAWCAGGDPPCGKTITVRNPATGDTADAIVVDQCGGGGGRILDLDPGVFNKLDTQGVGDKKGELRISIG